MIARRQSALGRTRKMELQKGLGGVGGGGRNNKPLHGPTRSPSQQWDQPAPLPGVHSPDSHGACLSLRLDLRSLRLFRVCLSVALLLEQLDLLLTGDLYVWIIDGGGVLDRSSRVVG